MAPGTHFLVSWVIAVHGTREVRDRRLVTLAGLAPDLDGLGLLVDLAAQGLGYGPTFFYQRYHHYWLHGWLGALLVSGMAAWLARDRWRVAGLSLLVFHLHLLCDLAGSRGPSPEDLWPIFYFGPFCKDPMWLWRGQWPLDGWPNLILTWLLFVYALGFAVRRGESFVSVMSPWADRIFVAMARRWTGRAAGWLGLRVGD